MCSVDLKGLEIASEEIIMTTCFCAPRSSLRMDVVFAYAWLVTYSRIAHSYAYERVGSCLGETDVENSRVD